MTLKEVIVNFLEGKEGGIATLKEIYKGVDESNYISNSNTVHDSARAIIYRHSDTFKRVCKGVYMLKGEKSTSLIINGDGRKMDEIEDNSIDLIITDHPWEDKKAHHSGNQKSFADYSTFRYEKSDFLNKAAKLKDGAYLVEFLPLTSNSNWRYLNEIYEMAAECNLNLYTTCIWRNAPEGTINTGRTTKGVQQIVIFSKGKPRKLSRPGVAGYMTKEILNYEIEILLKAKDKQHQAEKPVALYEYLIRNLTEEYDICLDQFGGSCNLAKASANLNRFSLTYELCKEFVEKAAKRYGFTPLYKPEDEETTLSDRVSSITKKVTYEDIANLFTLNSDGQYSFAM